MFFSSWRAALTPFGFSHFWGLLAALLGAYSLYFLLIRWATSTQESSDAAAPGCLVQVVGVLFQGLVLGAFVVFALPMLVGVEAGISWDRVQSFLLLAWRAGILASIIVGILTLIPYLGKFLGGNPGLETFLISAAIFRLSAPLFIEKNGSTPAHFPNLWESLGYLAAAWVLCKLLQLAFHYGRKLFPNTRSSRMISSVLGPTVDLFGGILAFLAYAAYVKMSL